MRKRLFFLATLATSLGAASGAHAQEASTCLIDTMGEPVITEVLSQYSYSFEGYETLCTSLLDAGMGVALVGVKGQVADRSYGLVTLTVFDRQSEVESVDNVTSTALDVELTDEGASQALMQAINYAMQFLSNTPERYITSARAERARLQTLFSEQ